jgi:tryptophan halogenase
MSKLSRQPRRIVLAGGSLAGWMTATALARVLNPADHTVTLAGADEARDGLAPLGVADATLPPPVPLHAALDLNEDGVVGRTGGSFSFGIALSGWNGPASVTPPTYFHPFSQIGGPLGPVSFHHIALRLRRDGAPLRLSNFALAALAAQAGRFMRPSPDPASVLSTCHYGLHLDCDRLAGLYRAEAERLGVRVARGHLQRVERTADGALGAVQTSVGERVEGDLFLDCTGVEARLLTALEGNGGGTGWEAWDPWLPCDRVLAAVVDDPVAPPPYSHAEARAAGWTRSLPLQGRTAFTALYATAHGDEEAALRQLKQLAGGRPLQDLHSHYVRFGRRRTPWLRNCIALGGAAALIDPVGLSNLQLLRAGADLLLQLLPSDADAAAEAAEFNRRFTALLDHARDFALAHYRLNGRSGEPFWDDCRAMHIPDTLDYKLRLYECRGRVPLYDEDPLEEDSWANLFDEHGLRPRAYTPIADGFRTTDLQSHVQLVRTVMLEAVKKMPAHADYLDKLS